MPAKRYDENNLPLKFDYMPDTAIPGRVWENFVPAKGRRSLVRALTESERATVERRAALLAPALEPYARPAEDDRVAEAVSAMFDSFTSMRQKGAAAVARVDGAMKVLEPLPAWAIEEGCLTIRRYGYEKQDPDTGKVRLEQTWPPGDSEIFAAVDRVAKVRRQALEKARELLAAPAPEKPAAAPARPSRPVDEVLAEYHREVGYHEAEAMQEEASARRTAAAAKAADAERLREYERAGLVPPEAKGGVLTSLPMMLKAGWRIEEVGARRVLVR